MSRYEVVSCDWCKKDVHDKEHKSSFIGIRNRRYDICGDCELALLKVLDPAQFEETPLATSILESDPFSETKPEDPSSTPSS